MPKVKKETSTTEKPSKTHIVAEIDRAYIKKIATRVKDLRVKSGYSSYESFALHAGINRNSYFRLEKSSSSGENFTLALLLKVIRGLDISISDFFHDLK